MADDNENNNTGNQDRTARTRTGRTTVRVDSISARRSSMDNVTVDRLNVKDGSPRDFDTEIFEDIKRVITDQTVTLEKAIKDSIRKMAEGGQFRQADTSGGSSGLANKEVIAHLEHIRSAIVASTNNTGGGGGDEGGSGGVDNYAEQMRNQRVYELLNKKTESNQKTLIDLQDAVNISLANFEEIFANINTKLEETISSFSRFSNVTDYVTERFRVSMEAARSGVADFYDIMADDLLLGGLRNNRDSLLETFKLVRNAAQNDVISPFGFIGNNIDEVASSLKSMRSTVDDMGYDLYGRFDFREFNESMLMLLQEQRRGNIQANLNDFDTTKNITRQLKFMDLIAQNTGRTVEEIVKQSQQDRQFVGELRASTILNTQQQENYINAIAQLNESGRSEFAGLVRDLASNAGNTSLLLGQNQDLSRALSASGNVENLQTLAELLNNSANLSPDEFQTQLNNIIRTFRPNGEFGTSGSMVFNEQARSLFGEANLTRDQINRQRRDDEGGIASMVNRIHDVFVNEIPWSSVAFVSAIGINTMALMRNTMALQGRRGGLGRLLRASGHLDSKMPTDGRTFRGRPRNYLLRRAAGNIASSPLRMAGRAAGGLTRGIGSIGKAVSGLGARALPGVGAVIGGIDAASRIASGDITGGLISTGAGLASFIPGFGTAASLGLYGLNAARDMGAFDSFGSDATSQASNAANSMYTPPSHTPVGSTIPSPRNETNTTVTILTEIRDEMRNSNEINRNIEKNTMGGTGGVTIANSEVDMDKFADTLAKGINRANRPRRPAVPYSGAENM